MKKNVLPILTLPMMLAATIMLPGAANAAQCRSVETGKFAKCGTAGSVPASQYVAKTKAKSSKAMAMPGGKKMAMPSGAMMAAPAMPAKPGFMASMKAKMKAKSDASTMKMPMTKPVRCKTMTGKFVKCGTPGAKPV